MIPIVDHLLGLFSQDLGVDLGTANTLIYVSGKGIVIREPSLVARHKKTKKIIAVGTDAKNMIGKAPFNIATIKPLKDGVISDYDTTCAMLSYFVKKVHQKPGSRINLPRPRLIIGVPSQITEVERRAILDVARDSGAREAFLVDEPMAAAIGAGIDVTEPVGSMIVDIGGGTCEIAVVSLGGIVVGRSLRLAGDAMDRDIINYVRTRYGLALGERTAEEVKLELGSVYPMPVEKQKTVRGQDLEKGLPKSVRLTSSQIREALAQTTAAMIENIKDTLNDAPPELASDISERGIVICGGGSLLYGMPKMISAETKMPVILASEPISCVVLGCAKLFSDKRLLSKVKMVSSQS